MMKRTKSDAEESSEEEPGWLDHMYPWLIKTLGERTYHCSEAATKQSEQFFDRFTDDEDSADDFDTVVAQYACRRSRAATSSRIVRWENGFLPAIVDSIDNVKYVCTDRLVEPQTARDYRWSAGR